MGRMAQGMTRSLGLQSHFLTLGTVVDRVRAS